MVDPKCTGLTSYSVMVRSRLTLPILLCPRQVQGVPQARVDSDGFIGAEAYLALDPVDGTTNFACGGPDWGVRAMFVPTNLDDVELALKRTSILLGPLTLI